MAKPSRHPTGRRVSYYFVYLFLIRVMLVKVVLRWIIGKILICWETLPPVENGEAIPQAGEIHSRGEVQVQDLRS